MRIAFDMDGVLADLHGAFADTAIRLFPELDSSIVKSPEVGASPPDLEEFPTEIPAGPTGPIANVSLTSAQSAAVWRELSATTNFWESLGEIEPGIVKKLATIAEERHWEVLFITSRPRAKGRTVQRQTQRWLEAKGFPLPSTYVVHGSRGQIAKALHIDVVVDDRPQNCLDVVLESGAAAILVWRGARGSVPASARRMGIAIVPTVEACLDVLSQSDRPEDQQGLLRRLRRLVGASTPRNTR
jgi:hypothetical protein